MKNQEADNRLRWKCRRGMLELDIMLQSFLKNGYTGLNSEDTKYFEQLLLVSCSYYVRLHIRNTLKKSVLKIYQEKNKNWLVETGAIEKKPVQLLASSFISQFFILINFSDDDGKKYSVFITVDSLSKAQYRRLIVRLKMH